MSEQTSGAFVFFGATGDLANKKIFPALLAMGGEASSVLSTETPIYQRDPATWGPPETDKSVAPFHGWQNPIVKE